MITYCTNIHPGERWNDIFSNLSEYMPTVKQAVSPGVSFPIGLRLSYLAATEINREMSSMFLSWCLENGYYVPTINGFPYGPFHSSSIKEKVYLPDWRQKERVEYTMILADLLDSWLPEGIRGSISTVPVGFKRHLQDADFAIVRRNLVNVLEHFDMLKQRSGKEIVLSLEPEPGCVLETAADTVGFFERMQFPAGLRESIGICLDCCHHAVEFEDPASCVDTLQEAGIRIGKVQVSSALRAKDFQTDNLDSFCDSCYLHQVVIQSPEGHLIRYDDLPDALRFHRKRAGEEWRIHFHIPVFMENQNSFGTTAFFAEEVLSLMEPDIPIEVETYTRHLLGPELVPDTVTESIIKEILWVRSKLYEKNSCS